MVPEGHRPIFPPRQSRPPEHLIAAIHETFSGVAGITVPGALTIIPYLLDCADYARGHTQLRRADHSVLPPSSGR